MIEFDEAIRTAGANVQKLIKHATNIELEGALISSDGRLYEITFSYDKNGSPSAMDQFQASAPGLKSLATILGKRREFKTFLVDSQTGAFRGFKNYKED
ncbi:hypothetical protein [Pseudomonas monteilii]|uniref:Uncharacterized protein n=1 Tax=Pseudomonas monteilii TaxID=76759 RepID=A0A399M1F2_9PSED|nr:hypothetical protein [Pseudomonas monteilii]RII74806.1 hypothetical protein D0894_24765 [Pseudomonas monteilii]